jgi:hypothetical protein
MTLGFGDEDCEHEGAVRARDNSLVLVPWWASG